MDRMISAGANAVHAHLLECIKDAVLLLLGLDGDDIVGLDGHPPSNSVVIKVDDVGVYIVFHEAHKERITTVRHG